MDINKRKQNYEYSEIPIKYSLENSFDDRFLKLKMYIAHDQINPNKSQISLETYEDAKETIKNIPILAYIINEDSTDENNQPDFTEHEIELKIVKDENGEIKDLKYKYLEQPIGLIAEDNNYHYETDEESGLTYVVVEGYIWAKYNDVAVQILKENQIQNLSMEIKILEDSYDYKKKILTIKKFKYLGITLLSNSIGTGMIDARAEVVEFAKKDENYTEMIKEFNESYQNYTLNLSNTDLKINNIDIKEEEKGMIKNKKEIAEMFKLTINQLYEELCRELCEVKYSCEYWDGSNYECNKYYLRDYDESFAYVVDCENGYMDMKIPYALEGDNAVLDFSNATRIKYQPTDWEGAMEGSPEEAQEMNSEDFSNKFVTEIGDNLKESFNKVLEEKIKDLEEKFALEKEQLIQEKETLSTSIQEKEQQFAEEKESFTNEIDTIKGKFSILEEETNELRTFKQEKLDAEKQEKIEGLFARFIQLSEDEKAPLKEKAKELDMEELENKLFAMVGRKSASNFSLQKNSEDKVITMDLNIELEDEKDGKSYDSIIKKYIKK